MTASRVDRQTRPSVTPVTLTLTRTDAARIMPRYYQMDVKQELFGAWRFIHEWGASAGQVRCASSPTPDEADTARRSVGVICKRREDDPHKFSRALIGRPPGLNAGKHLGSRNPLRWTG